MKRSILKKMIVLTLAFAMVFSSVITSVSANEAELTATLTATADKESYVAGDTVVVTFAVTGEVDAIGLTYGFDAGLTFVSAEWIIADAKIADVDLEKGNAAIAFDGAAILSETAVFAMTFTADADGEYAVTATPVMKNGAANVAADTAVATVVVGASHECVFGDWQNDENGHWKECDCGLKSEEGAHDYANACDALCDTCGYTREVGDHALGAYEYNDEGHWQTCGECGTKTDVAAHEYGDWVIDTEATNTAAGSKHAVCACGHTIVKTIPAVMKFASASLTLESSITVNYKVKPEYFTKYGYTNHYVIFTCNGKSTRVDNYTIEGSGSSQRYVFEFNGVSSYMMSYEIVAVLYAEYEGELYQSAEQAYSVKQYCYNQLSKSSDANFKRMLVDLLNYGTAAQQKWGHSLDNLANAELTAEQKALGTSTTRDYVDNMNAKYETIETETATWKAAALLLEDAVIIRTRFITEDLTDLTVKVTTSRGKEFEIPNENITWNDSASRYEILFDDLMAYEMSDIAYFTLCRDGVATSNTLSYSIESYVARNKDNSYTALLTAMMNYGDSARVYFKK